MKKNVYLLTCAALIGLVPAPGRGAEPCGGRLGPSASRIRSAASALSSVLGADARSRLPDANRAVLYADVFVQCTSALAIQGAPGGGSGVGVCVAATQLADAADPGASPRISGVGTAPALAMTLALERSATFGRAFLTRKPPEPLGQRASDLLGAVDEGGNILRGCSDELNKPRLVLSSLPAVPTLPPAVTNFDGYLASLFSVHRDSGKATVGSADATLEGAVTISLKNDPSAKVSMNGRIVLGAGAAGGSSPSGNAMASKVNTGLVQVGPSVRTWTTLEGQGSVRILGFGPDITIPSVNLQYQSGSVLFSGGEAPVRGCTHTLGAGSGFSSSGISLEGSLKCGPWTLTASSMGLERSRVSGGGTFSAWNKSFSMSYSVSNDVLTATGTLSGPDTPWTRIPGLEAEYRIEAPKLDVTLQGPSLSPVFNLSKLSVRTTANKPNGNPWSSASLTPGAIVVPAPPTDGIPVPFPSLPSPGDVEKSLRDACLSVAVTQGARELCRSGHPSPPGIPSLSSRISLKVGDIFR
jgi:hypothetical protein